MTNRNSREDRLGFELLVRHIPSARLGEDLITTATDRSVAAAQTAMLRHGFSQLPVSDVKAGAVVSWRSIARASLATTPEFVGECTEDAEVCALEASLLPMIPRIVECDYVLVKDGEDKVVGIVTAADLTNEFQSLAGPFLVIGQCEVGLRELVKDRISADVLLEYAPKWARNGQDPIGHLGLRDIEKAIEVPANWAAVGLRLSQEQMLDWIDSVRSLRNEVAHFQEDSAEAARRFADAQRLAELLHSLRRHR